VAVSETLNRSIHFWFFDPLPLSSPKPHFFYLKQFFNRHGRHGRGSVHCDVGAWRAAGDVCDARGVPTGALLRAVG